MKFLQLFIALLSVAFATFSFANIHVADEQLLVFKNQAASWEAKIKQHFPTESIETHEIQATVNLESEAQKAIQSELQRFHSVDIH
jgi:hypothetical protein